MTGFARVEGTEDGYSWAWEVRSVNARSLDVRIRLPSGMDRLEAGIRKKVSDKLNRGNISATLVIARPPRKQEVVINSEILEQVLSISNQMSESDDIARPRVDGLLSVRGVIELQEEEETDEEKTKLDAEVEKAFEAALDGLVENRESEGKRLLDSIISHLDEIAGYVDDAANIDAAQPKAIANKLREQVRDLAGEVSGVTEDRLAQEVALLATKADIREELDRLSAHVAGARDLLAAGSPVGRKLDFLCQEFNREANTVCSKSSDLDLTRVGLELKAVIERLREQIQNIE
ncbi:MAG: YicC family protein [Rhodospirillaceae bacterium]|nr:YicC family protein [Rhodospirillaceae bacterium]|tara:strand:- start:4207 stop:5079 length:873 start_codon:yes stop_codon:yes gene_type:complete